MMVDVGMSEFKIRGVNGEAENKVLRSDILFILDWYVHDGGFASVASGWGEGETALSFFCLVFELMGGLVFGSR